MASCVRAKSPIDQTNVDGEQRYNGKDDKGEKSPKRQTNKDPKQHGPAPGARHTRYQPCLTRADVYSLSVVIGSVDGATAGIAFLCNFQRHLPAQRPVGEVWRKIGVVGGCGAEAGFVPGGGADINKLAHRMTGWEGIWGAKGVNGDKGEMPVRLGGCQQVGRRSCWRIARILDRALKSLGTLVAIRVEGTPGVAPLLYRSEQAVGKLATNEDHRNSPPKSLNNKIQYLDS